MNSTTIYETSDPSDTIEYTGTVLASSTSDLQSWTVLQTDKDTMLFIDSQHQLSKHDEHIYHEQFVHSLLCGIVNPRSILILGGGDGCTAREVVKWPSVKYVTQVDWDKSLVTYFTEQGAFWNSNVYKDPRVQVIIEDVSTWIQTCTQQFDAIFLDLLDPSDSTIQFLQTVLQSCKKLLSPKGGLSINAGHVTIHRPTYASTLAKYMKDLFPDPIYNRVAAHAYIPSFLWSWGFLQIVPSSWSRVLHDTNLPKGLLYSTKDRILKSIRWPLHTPIELSEFWISTGQTSCKKLTSISDSNIFTEHYGC